VWALGCRGPLVIRFAVTDSGVTDPGVAVVDSASARE
jgi:hypothetical protein